MNHRVEGWTPDFERKSGKTGPIAKTELILKPMLISKTALKADKIYLIGKDYKNIAIKEKIYLTRKKYM